MSEDDFNEKVKRKFAEFERKHGRTPTIKDLAKELGIDSRMLGRKLQKAIATMGLDAYTEGTSAFKSTLREMLSGDILNRGRPGMMQLSLLADDAKNSVNGESRLRWGEGKQECSLTVCYSEKGIFWHFYRYSEGNGFARICDDVSVISDLLEAIDNGENVDSELITHMEGEPKLFEPPVLEYQDPIPADQLPPNVLPFTKPYQHSDE